MNVADLEPRRHEPPPGWSAEAFGLVTDALAAALVAAVRRQAAERDAAESQLGTGR